MIWIQTLLAVFLVSLVSLVGILVFYLKEEKVEKMLIYLVSLSVGTLLGGALIHLVPESFENESINTPLFILLGVFAFFVLEKAVAWRHCHEIECEEHQRSFSYNILFGDAMHNFIDGAIIAASFMVDTSLGVATTVAVIFHEIPQEIGDFGALVYAGFSKLKALLFNFASALSALLGAVIVLSLGETSDYLIAYLIPITAGGFIYIAMTDLTPELHKKNRTIQTIGQLFFMVAGVALMIALTNFE